MDYIAWPDLCIHKSLLKMLKRINIWRTDSRAVLTTCKSIFRIRIIWLPKHQPWDNAIDIKPDAPETIGTKVYPMSVNKQEELNCFLEENLAKGYIVPSKSPIASPVFFVKKKDRKLWFVQDYHQLNEHTVKNCYPLPLISGIITYLQQAKIFPKLDVWWGYNNIRIKEGLNGKRLFWLIKDFLNC